jgi:DNA polymerase-3 subunit gamma/tau
MGQALYRKWRPQTFDDIVGQDHVVRTLRNALQTGHLHHAYLLAGPRGTGKTTTARLIAKAVNCLAPLEARPCDACELCNAITEGRLMDLIEIDAASNTGVDNIRDLLEKVGFRPTQGRYKVYVVDEVHMLSTAAFNALLKTLEEPPEHVIFVLATTEVHKIPETILSRCQRFEFRRIPLAKIVTRLTKIAEAEQVETEPEALDLIARAATGSMRDAISLFDQMAAAGEVTADYVRMMLGAERREVVQKLLHAWISRDLKEGVQIINDAVDSGADPRQLARQTADFLRGLLLMRLGAGKMWADPTAEERARLQEMARQAEPDRLVEAVRLFSQVASARHTGWQPQLPLEIAFVEATLDPEPAPQAPATAAATQHAPQERPRASQPRASQPRASQPRASKPRASQTSTPKRRVRSVAPRKTADAKATEEGKAQPDATVSPALAKTIAQRWDDVVSKIRPFNLGAFLRDAKPASVDADGFLVLAFQHEFHRNNVNKDANRRVIEDFLTKAFQHRVGVRCVLAQEWTPAPAETGPAEAQEEAPEEDQEEDAAASSPQPPDPVEDDELVRRATEELGAEVKVTEA